MSQPNHRFILPIIVTAQFLCTSLWFAGNAVVPDLIVFYELPASLTGSITSSVQFGFISGTLFYAALMFADRFHPSRVFFFSALAAALANLCIGITSMGLTGLLVLRFITGFFLAGIYPVGMKIAADYFEKGLGRALGLLVGALVIGTAFPHLLKNYSGSFKWQYVLMATSCLSATGGLLMLLFVPKGPYLKKLQALRFNAITGIFRNRPFRSAAVGYFGHMWELYAFWTFVPFFLKTFNSLHPTSAVNIPLYSFFIIASGGPACVISGYLSSATGVRKTAFAALLCSCCCCLFSPWAFNLSASLFTGFLIFWGAVVVADSPLFSTLVANNAAAEIKGTALTAVTCIGFSLTIISIELLNYLVNVIDNRFLFVVLAAGPIFSLWYMFRSQLVAVRQRRQTTLDTD